MNDERAKEPGNQKAETDGDTTPTDRSLSDAELREYWEWWLGRHKVDFIATGNPMFAFFGYVKARMLGITPPDWILEYLDRSVESFQRAYVKFCLGVGPNDPATALSAAFGVKKAQKGQRSGGPTCWDDFNLEEHRFDMGSYVEEVILEWSATSRKVKRMAAVAEATKRYNKKNGTKVSEATVRRAWLDFRECLARPNRQRQQRLREIFLQQLDESLKRK
jgi:hypothetical protein